MPRLVPVLTAFSTGEVTPDFSGRVDFAKYFQGCETLENYLVEPTGGARRRAGTRYLAPAKASNVRCRLLPFSFNTAQTYALEAGAGYLRFFSDSAQVQSAGVPLEVTTPYLTCDLRQIHTVQSADVMFFFHPDYAIRQLERYSATQFRFRASTFTPPPSREYGARSDVTAAGAQMNATITPAATSGNNILFTTSQACLRNADVGREILIVSGTNAGARAIITVYNSTTTCHANISEAFTNTTANAAGSWVLTVSPKTTITAAAAGPVGTVTTATLSAAGWRDPDDCGKFILMTHGELEINSFVSTTVANVTVQSILDSTTAQLKGTWSLEEASWSAINGYPATGTLGGGRLWAAGTAAQPDTFWGSQSNDYPNFASGTADSDAPEFTLGSSEVNVIRWLRYVQRLLIGTSGGEFTAQGAGDDPISPTTISVRDQTVWGSSTVAPARSDNAVLFVTRSGRRLREMVERTDTLSQAYASPDLLLLASHLTSRDRTIVELSVQREPVSRIWAVRSDGTLLVCTYLREQNVVAWSRVTTQGAFESLTIIPRENDDDQVYVAVRRVINGATVRWIEVFDNVGLVFDQLYLDAAITCDSLTNVTSVRAAHLNGESVQFTVDGAVQAAQTVAANVVTLNPCGMRVEIGLPYTSTLVTLRPEFPTGAGSMQPMKKRWVQLLVRMIGSLGVTINGELYSFRRQSDPMGVAVPVQTRDVEVNQLGDFGCDGRVTIQQTQPFPSHVVMISGVVDVGGA